MGEAKRRQSRPPNAAQRMFRWLNRVWLMYPRPIRTFYRVNAEIVGVVAIALLILLAIALGVQLLFHR